MLQSILQTACFFLFLAAVPDVIKYVYSWANNVDVWRRLEKKWILVTNANTAVGFAICRRLAARGLRLVLTGTNLGSLHTLRDSLLHLSDKIVCYQVDYSAQADHSFVEKYDIGLVINKIGFYEAQPAAFADSDLDFFIDHNFRGPLLLIKAVVSRMVQKNFGYVLNVSFRYTDKPRAYYSLIAAVKSMFRAWSESMYYELKESKVAFEYMETGDVSLDAEDASLFAPSVDRLVDSVLSSLGSSYFTVPYFPHFCEYTALRFMPRFLVARYRKLYVKRFAKQVNRLY